MPGLFSNPANWAITNKVQRQGNDDVLRNVNFGGFLSGATGYQGTPGGGVQPTAQAGFQGGANTSSYRPQGTPSVLSANTTGGSQGQVGGGGSVGGGGPVIDQNLIAQYNQAIGNTNSAINRLGGQQNAGNQAIDVNVQNALQQLLLGRNRSQGAYTSGKQQTSQDYVSAKNTIGAQAGQALNGLRRLLGSRGAGGGSAYNIAAPEAVARGATLQRAGATDTYGQNNQALDTNWNNFVQDYDNQVKGVNNQRDQSKQSLQGSIDNNRASLLQSLAQLTSQKNQAQGGNGVGASQPYINQANAIMDRASNYTTAPINYQNSAFAAPTLDKYTSAAQTPTVQGQQPGNDYFSPYLAALLGKKQQAF